MNLTDMEAGLYLRKSRADEDGQSVEDVCRVIRRF